MRTCLSIFLVTLLAAASACAEVEVLPPDFVVFGKTASDYAANLYRYVYPLSTNMDYLFPKAGPLDDPRVYFLARPIFPGEPQGIPTYFVPDNAYVFFPIYAAVWDNVDSCPPCYSVEQLRDAARAYVDAVTAVHATIDEVTLPDLLDHRVASAVFSVYFADPDNFESLIVGHPFVGLDDPMVADGYFLMIKPLSAGIHDFRTGGRIGDPNGFAFERHYQIHSLPLSEFLARQARELKVMISESFPSQNRQQPLVASVNAAIAAFDSGNVEAAANHLSVFRKKLHVQVAPRYPNLAEQLSQLAQRIIDHVTAQNVDL